jgi:hypothetical protein
MESVACRGAGDDTPQTTRKTQTRQHWDSPLTRRRCVALGTDMHHLLRELLTGRVIHRCKYLVNVSGEARTILTSRFMGPVARLARAWLF